MYRCADSFQGLNYYSYLTPVNTEDLLVIFNVTTENNRNAQKFSWF